MDECLPISLQDLGKIVFKAIPPEGIHLQGTSGMKRSIQSFALTYLIRQMKETTDVHSQNNLDNQMHREKNLNKFSCLNFLYPLKFSGKTQEIKL